jgi:DNA-binding response OmpR family regulator
MTFQPGRILIVDDEANIRAGLREILKKEGHEIDDAATGQQALDLLKRSTFETVIADIRMPGMSGVELLDHIRKDWPYISVVLLTGHGTLETAMEAVKKGAHNYLLKPARPREIRSAIEAALLDARRRTRQAQLLAALQSGLDALASLDGVVPAPVGEAVPAAPEQFTLGDLIIDTRAHDVQRDGQRIALSISEFNLLVAMATRAGEVLDYVTLVELTLGYQVDRYEARELIKRHIFTLRHKIELEPNQPRYIMNVRGIGYRLEA